MALNEKRMFRKSVLCLTVLFMVFIINNSRADAYLTPGCECDDLEIFPENTLVITGIVLGVILAVGIVVALGNKKETEWYSELPPGNVTLTGENKARKGTGYFLSCRQTGSDITLACW